METPRPIDKLIRVGLRNALLACVGLLFLGGVLVLGQESTGGTPDAARKRAPEVSRNTPFCPVKPAGQLCDHRTAALLNLSGEKRGRWNAALQEYNEAVASDQRRLITEAEKFLSPAELEQVKNWFVPSGQKLEGQPRANGQRD